MSVALTRFSNRPGIHNPCSKNSVNKDLKVLKKKTNATLFPFFKNLQESVMEVL